MELGSSVSQRRKHLLVDVQREAQNWWTYLHLDLVQKQGHLERQSVKIKY